MPVLGLAVALGSGWAPLWIALLIGLLAMLAILIMMHGTDNPCDGYDDLICVKPAYEMRA